MSEFKKLFTKIGVTAFCASFTLTAVAQSISLQYDSLGRFSKSIDGGVSTEIEYDSSTKVISRVKRIKNAGILRDEFEYIGPDSWVLSKWASSRSAESYTTNVFGQIFGESSAEKGTISYVLNNQGYPQKITDAKGVITEYTYLPSNLDVSTITSSDYSASYTYGPQGTPGAGRVIAAQRSGTYGSVSTSITYNKSGRIIGKSQTVSSMEEPGSSGMSVSYQYAGDKLMSITYPSGAIISYQYTGNTVSKVLLNGDLLIDNVTFVAGVTYGAISEGAFTSWDGVYAKGTATGATSVPYRTTVDTTGNITSYSFGGLNSIGQWGVRQLTWNVEKMKSRLSSRSSPFTSLSGVSEDRTYQYDAYDHIVSTQSTQVQPGGASTTVQQTYSYNSNHGINSQTRTSSGATVNMPANVMGNSDQLSSAKVWNEKTASFEDQSYTYDASGQLVQLSANSSSGNYALNLTWDSQGELVKMTNSNANSGIYSGGTSPGVASASYYYDAFGTRVKKVTKDTNGALLMSTGFVYADGDPYKLLAEYTLNHEATRNASTTSNFSSNEYVYLPNPLNGRYVPVAMLKQSSAGAEVFYMLPDQLGRVSSVIQARASVTTQGMAVDNLAYVEYSGTQGEGKAVYREDFALNSGFNLRAPGQYFDTETGLLYNHARYVHPGSGRFISGDPIGKHGGTNVYAYGVGNLVNDVDESGFAKTNKDNRAGGRSPTLDGWTNGNWGGGKWSGGVGGGAIGTAPPLDSGDECYMRHDLCYAAGTDEKICDKTLVKELKDLGSVPQLWPRPPRHDEISDSINYLRLAIGYFESVKYPKLPKKTPK